MALSEFRHLYEVLVRFNDQGAYQGAHVQYLEGVKRDGVVIQAQPGPAMPLALAEGGDQTTLAAVLGDAVASALDASTSALASAASREEDATRAIQAAEDAVAAAQEAEGSAKTALAEAIDALAAEREALAAERAALAEVRAALAESQATAKVLAERLAAAAPTEGIA